MLLCLMLPGEHISTLRFMMLLLATVAANSENNKMDTTNLAVVLAPNIMHVNSKTVTMKSCEEKLLQVQTSVVELLIQHAEEVGMVDDLLVEKTAFMSEVFSTDDELDASEDNLEDSKDTRKKEKKRKRSGSFQGFVSSIAQSITKWRRSTDGKTNTSGISQGSNMSQMSNASDRRAEERGGEECDRQGNIFQFSAAEQTPVVRRKKAPQKSEGRAFSASKKKAILQQLPQHSTLASTPFTPASHMKRMDINSVRRAGAIDTPSIPPRPYQCTPRVSMKTPRKKLTLFSPASTTKKKRYSSSTNLSVQSASKKTSKKGIFRRLSGSKGDQMLHGPTPEVGNRKQIGHRLASPNSTDTSVSSSMCGNTSKSIKDDSPIAALAPNSSFSSSVCEQSVISTFDDERRSLNEGFIMTEEKEVDISRIMSEPALAGSHDPGEYVMLEDILPRETTSDTTIMADSRYNTPRAHSRSFSVDSILDNSAKKSSLKRGRPNSLKAGLLQGDQKEVQKLRRSFGLDKSDIGYPVPISVADTSNCDQYIQLDSTLDDLMSSKAGKYGDMSNGNLEVEDCVFPDPDSPGSVSRNKVSTASVANSVTGYDCDDESSEAGFSTVSCSTTHSPLSKQCQKSVTTTTDKTNSLDVKKSLAEQKQESKDSLLSGTSASMTPPQNRDREMTRSVSADSGKGSLYEEPLDDGPEVPHDSSAVPGNKEEFNSTSSILDTTTAIESAVPSLQNTSVKSLPPESFVENSGNITTFSIDSVEKPPLQNKKSMSSQDLTKEFQPTPTRVSRSKSLLETSLAQRKQNVKPNLQISAETHKLLARAGYIKDNKAELVEEMDDFPVSGSLKFPVIKQAETVNPRRESIIALRKNNAGFVKSNVKQFDQISGTTDLVTKHTSPLRFPNSTSRRKGMSPLKIPTAFSTSDDLQEGVALMKEKWLPGVARVPISTQLIKPSNPVSETEAAVNEAKTGLLKRKPSVYYADRESVSFKYRNILSKTVCERISEERSSEEVSESGKDSLSEFERTIDLGLDDTVFENSDSLKSEILSTVKPVGKILEKTIDVQKSENKENTVENGSDDSCLVLGSIPATPINVEASALRTASNKTPVEILKTVKPQRSPVKPLKRLRSPHSPRCKISHSPKLLRSQALFSTTSSQIDELNNL